MWATSFGKIHMTVTLLRMVQGEAGGSAPVQVYTLTNTTLSLQCPSFDGRHLADRHLDEEMQFSPAVTKIRIGELGRAGKSAMHVKVGTRVG